MIANYSGRAGSFAGTQTLLMATRSYGWGKLMQITVMAVVFVYALLTGAVSVSSLKDERVRGYGALGLCGSIMLLAGGCLMLKFGLASIILCALGLAAVQAQTYLNGKRLYQKVHLSHHIMRAVVHLAILAAVVITAWPAL